MNNYSNNKLHDPHDFIEEVNIKYNGVKAVAGWFPYGIAIIMASLEAEAVPLNWVDYCTTPPANQVVWEEREKMN